MKKIIISVFSLAILFLGGCQINMSGCSIEDIKNIGTFSYKESETYTEYINPVTTGDNILEINVSWIDGEVEFIRGDAFNVTEECISGTYYPLYYRIIDGKLDIKFVQNGTSSSLINNLKKKITITSPTNLTLIDYNGVSSSLLIDLDEVENLDIDNVSGLQKIDLDKANKIDIDNVSGEININVSEINIVDIESVSGECSVKLGKATYIDFNTISSNIYLELFDTSEITKIDLDTTSADIKLALDDVRGYRLDFSTVSGEKDIEFSDGSDVTLSRYVIDASTISGDITIKRIEK